MNNEEVERFVSIFEEKIYAILKSAFEQTRQEIDITTLAEAVASQDQEAIADALGTAYENLEQQLGEDMEAPLNYFTDAVIITAIAALGHVGHTLHRNALVVRDILRYQTAKTIAEFHRDQIIRSTNFMYADGIPPRTVARYLIQNIGLSDNQQRSLNTFREVLTRAQKRGGNYIPASQYKRLNASQRSILKAAMAGEITNEDVEKLTNKQRKILENHRAQVTARTMAQTAVNGARQAAWESLDRSRLIDGYRRFWVHRNDERVRHTHRAIPALNLQGRGLQEPFKTPLGPAHSPPLEINCRCRVALRRPS